MSEGKKIVGIDLGTTYSVISYFPPNAIKPEVIKNQEGENTTPSVIAVNKKGEVIVGTRAKELRVGTYKASVIEFVKRYMGEFDDNGEPTFTRIIKDEVVDPPEISSFILDKLKKAASLHFQEEITHAIITVPAYFTMKQCEATKQAAELAGLTVVQLINEPTAAAISYGLGLQESGKQQLGSEYFLVYDLGGGTMDISIMEIVPRGEDILPRFNVISISGDHMLGGSDFDKILTNLILEKIVKKYKLDIKEDDEDTGEIFNKIYDQIYIKVEKYKQLLSDLMEIDMEFNYIPSPGGEALTNVEITVTRDEYEAAIMPLLQRTMELIDEAIEKASKKITIDDINTILLVGGASKTPIISKLITEKFGFEPNIYEPDLSVSFGAAILGAVKSDIPISRSFALKKKQQGEISISSDSEVAEGQLEICDCISHSLGVEVQEGFYSIIIDRLTEYPCSEEGIYSTQKPGQQIVIIRVYQGEEPIARNNTFLGEFDLKVVKVSNEKIPIKVKFDIDESGILTVTATDVLADSKSEVKIKGTSTVGLSRTEFEEKRRRLETLKTGSTQISEQSFLMAKFKDRFEQINAIMPTLKEKQRNLFIKKAEQLKKAILSNNQEAIDEADNALMDLLLMAGEKQPASSSALSLDDLYRDFIKKIEDKLLTIDGQKKEMLSTKLISLKSAVKRNDTSEANKLKETLEDLLLML